MDKIKYYTDKDQGILNANLLDQEADEISKSFFIKENGKIKSHVSGSQIRRFYHEVKTLEKKLEEKSNWGVIFPLVKMMKSKVVYATSEKKVSRHDKTVYSRFKDFLITGIDSIADEKDFYGFCKYFESVIGYYYGNGGKDK